MSFTRLPLIGLLLLSACASPPPAPAPPAAEYLYLWTASADEKQPDFLAVARRHRATGSLRPAGDHDPRAGSGQRPASHRARDARRPPAVRQRLRHRPELRLRPLQPHAAAHRRPVRRRGWLFAPALVPAAAERQRARHVPDAPREGWHADRRPRRADARRQAGALALGGCARRRSGASRLQRRHHPGAGPHRHHDHRHGQGLRRVAQPAAVASVGSLAAPHLRVAGWTARR